jgi:hypothetical protein
LPAEFSTYELADAAQFLIVRGYVSDVTSQHKGMREATLALINHSA